MKIVRSLDEDLAEQCHDSWSNWMRYVYTFCSFDEVGNAIIPEDKAKRWQRQMNTPYSALPEEEKESDRKEAKKFRKVVDNYI